jgi:hypothetical protein
VPSIKGKIAQHDRANPSPVSRIIIVELWGSSSDAPVRFKGRKWEEPDAWVPRAAIWITDRHKDFFRRAKVRQDF